ncbi:TadE/TadG family type IV pilus assembly protein [Nocardioides sp. AX2bis]|uniref:TadE/TadG family type IV pilus assembly protein n=1 Tax=Nocardioides sp. AX2bis TaxID=2653157 RepID=UPI00135BEEC0|nr:TadE/TadG family type IV pilus assembly protein [Nocardioides sp. AX2bis]
MEFALVLPLLLVLLFGIIGYGYMLSFRQGISQAAAEGARTAAVLSSSDPAVVGKARDAVNGALGSCGVTCGSNGTLMKGTDPAGTCTISARKPCSNAATAQCVEVSLAYTYRDDPLLPSFPGLGIVLPEQLSYSTEAQVN